MVLFLKKQTVLSPTWFFSLNSQIKDILTQRLVAFYSLDHLKVTRRFARELARLCFISVTYSCFNLRVCDHYFFISDLHQQQYRVSFHYFILIVPTFEVWGFLTLNIMKNWLFLSLSVLLMTFTILFVHILPLGWKIISLPFTHIMNSQWGVSLPSWWSTSSACLLTWDLFHTNLVSFKQREGLETLHRKKKSLLLCRYEIFTFSNFGFEKNKSRNSVKSRTVFFPHWRLLLLNQFDCYSRNTEEIQKNPFRN